jgi:protoporphyrinogen oxidase
MPGMDTTMTRVAVLGGGPAGLGAAWQAARSREANVVLFEQRLDVGGNSGSFEVDGIPVDFGSHRLHPACAPRILDDLRGLLDGELLDRPRHGRIRLRGRWIHFPLKPVDLMVSLPPSFGAGVAADATRKAFVRGRTGGPETFASVLERNLGRTICRDFYFPYAVKIWGVEPNEISPAQAYKRVSAGTIAKMVRKALGLVPGLKAPGAGRFFYPRNGFGRISEAIADAARECGAEIALGTTVREIRVGSPHVVVAESDGVVREVEVDHVWSTLPVPLLARIASPKAPPTVIDAARRLRYRAMVLIYVVLGTRQFTPFDAHYFPEAAVRLTRLSEPKNYGARAEPTDRTVLCAELPCDVGDSVWEASDDELGELVCEDLARSGLPVDVPVLDVTARRLSHAYPIYLRGYEQSFTALDEWATSLDHVLTFGRQGLFAHDNTHHALAMAYAAVDCLAADGTFDRRRWNGYRKEFETHVVED